MTDPAIASTTGRQNRYGGDAAGTCREAARTWRKSSRSEGSEGQCVEVAARADRGVALRDSKDVEGPMLSLAPSTWTSLVVGIKDGSFDLTP
ncbi:DUF397 domain-containing protein [Actinomadura sp. NAK00032]|uniref:DUF397 domain-containing protein n=1 Tax=Actinomadura sp. NAK00032 TaxID=2742128 RepID=UPI0015900FBD|nr:DUF397 domain-containing protein [Actinomadura sp. NAK00032]QKW35507.1 DUF397 domain-containing protein [Actinomadura sp. NAK00032]